jgi:hypothetical protein
MPGGVRWDPTKEPFSYWKVCFYYLPCTGVLLWTMALLAAAFGEERWLDKLESWLPSSTLQGAAMSAAFVLGYYLFFMKILWRLLPMNVRERIPYDRQEATQSKGDIKSLWDLRKLVLPTRN